MFGTFGGDRQTVELTRQPDGEITDVDHLLDLAEPLREDLAGLDRDEHGQVVLVGAELLPEFSHHSAALGAGHRAPDGRRRARPFDRVLKVVGGGHPTE